jgi:hypothetical protein
MEKRCPSLFVVSAIALLMTEPAFAEVVLFDWMAPPHLGMSASQPSPDEAKPILQTEPAKTVPATTAVGTSIIPDDVELPPDGPNGTPIPSVPEPSTWVLLMLGFAGVGFLTYRRLRSAAA